MAWPLLLHGLGRGCRKALRGLECAGRVPESKARSVWEGCRKQRLESTGRVPESKAWSVREGCRKARLGECGKSAGKQGLESAGRVPESKARSVWEGCWKQGLACVGRVPESMVCVPAGCRKARFCVPGGFRKARLRVCWVGAPVGGWGCGEGPGGDRGGGRMRKNKATSVGRRRIANKRGRNKQKLRKKKVYPREDCWLLFRPYQGPPSLSCLGTVCRDKAREQYNLK